MLDKNICTRCGESVGHRGTDTECPPCQYLMRLESVVQIAGDLAQTEFYGLSNYQQKALTILRKELRKLGGY